MNASKFLEKELKIIDYKATMLRSVMDSQLSYWENEAIFDQLRDLLVVHKYLKERLELVNLKAVAISSKS
jgi:hypothetical protein